jgi:NADPH2:quinone reductase
VKIPDGVDLQTAAAVMLQGTTAHYLTHSTYKLETASTCLVHAAAGGTGGLIVQMAKHLGARVFGTVSSADKARQIQELGADHAIIYTTEDFEAEVKRLTDGKGVDVVYDSVGRTTFDKSLSVLRPRGTMALFGQSSGPVPPFDPSILNAKGSLFLTRPSLAHHLLDRKELVWRVSDVFRYIASGALKVRISGTYPLAEAASAHEKLEGRQTLGKLLLKVA